MLSLSTTNVLQITSFLQVKPNTENGHVVLNLLVDHGRIESVGLVADEAHGRRLLEDGQAWRNLSNIWCACNEGPVDMKRTAGGAKSIWPWPSNKQIPQPLLSAVCFSIDPKTDEDVVYLLINAFTML